jgi:competence protein ComEC
MQPALGDSPRCPLLWPVLFFGGGCALAFLPVAHLAWAGLGFVLASALWYFTKGRVQFCLFLLATLGAGLYWTLLSLSWVAADDLRRMSLEERRALTQWTGTVASLPKARGLGQEFIWRLRSRVTEGKTFPVSGRVLLRVTPALGMDFKVGQSLRVLASLIAPETAANPGGFDARAYLAQQRIYDRAFITLPELEFLDDGPSWNLSTWARQAQSWTSERLTLGLQEDPVVVAVLKGMLLGDPGALPYEWEAIFRETGTFHIFAVSGQNIGVLLVMGLFFFPFSRWRWAWLFIPLLGFYAFMVGLPASVIRAWLMASLVLLTWRLERPLSYLNLWALALGIVLLSEPQAVQDIGMQLSFAVVAALIVIAPPLSRFLYRPWARDPFVPPSLASPRMHFRSLCGGLGAGLLSASVAAWLGSAPLLAWHFHQFCYVGLLANLVVVPLASGIVMIGTLGIFSGPLGIIFNQVNWLLVHGLLGTTQFFALWPGASLAVPDVSVWGKGDRFSRTILVASTGGTSTVVLPTPQRVTWINAGRERDARGTIFPLAAFYGWNQPAEVFLPQSQVNYMGGALLLSRRFQVTHWFSPPGKPRERVLREALKTLHPIPQTLRAGDSWPLKDGTVRVLWPEGAGSSGRAADQALVLLLEWRGHKILYAGNISFGTEQALLRRWPGLRAEVLIQGANPLEPNLSAAWLDQLRPAHLIRAAPPLFQRRVFAESFPVTVPHIKVWRQELTGTIFLEDLAGQLQVRPFRSRS